MVYDLRQPTDNEFWINEITSYNNLAALEGLKSALEYSLKNGTNIPHGVDVPITLEDKKIYLGIVNNRINEYRK